MRYCNVKQYFEEFEIYICMYEFQQFLRSIIINLNSAKITSTERSIFNYNFMITN